MTSDLHIEVSGDGPPVVLLHGWGLHGGVFAPLVDRLADHFTLHRVDLPGHGRSRDSSIPLQLEPCVAHIASCTPPAPWLGWSLGGLFALHAAATRPDRVTGLVMVCATPCFVRVPGWRHAVDESVFAQFALDLQHDYRGTLERFIALDTFGSEHARDELRILRHALYAHGEPTTAALQDGLSLLQSTDLRPLLPPLACPSLWISGGRDRLVPSSAVEEAVRITPGATHLPAARSAHVPFIGHADVVARAIGKFARTPDRNDTARRISGTVGNLETMDRRPRAGGDPTTFACSRNDEAGSKVTGPPSARR